MKPSKRFGRFGCVPLEMDPAWLRIPYMARSIGRDLMAIADLDTMQVPVDLGDWQDSVCLKLHLSGNCRRNARQAMQLLVDRGFVTLGPRWLTVNLQPVCAQPALNLQSTDGQPALNLRSTGRHRASKVSQALGITHITSDRSEESRAEQNRSDEPESDIDPNAPEFLLKSSPKELRLLERGRQKLKDAEAAE